MYCVSDRGKFKDIDNFFILDGPAQAPWLRVEPESGTVSSGSSATVNLLFDATDVEPGTYNKILNISSNDPEIPNVSVPVTLVFLPNLPPVLSAVIDKSVRELGSLNLTFTATDADDSIVYVSLENAPSFVTQTSAVSGSATYSVKPLIGDAGNYEITVVAKDGRGGMASQTFNLEVIRYGVQNFSLISLKNGGVIQNFEDTVTLDVADPNIKEYTIRANTSPSTVGSVKFTLDGSTTNTDNSKPYTISSFLLPKLSGGDHSFTAQAFTKSNGNGIAAQIKPATIRMINSAAITDFDVVNIDGVKLLDLQEGGVIDISQANFSKINIVANTSISTVRSVEFTLNGATGRTDNAAPFALKGDNNGNDTFWPVKPGFYTLTARPYMKMHAYGPEGILLTIHFRVVNGTGPTVANARIGGDSADENEGEEMLLKETGEPVWSVYPVPVKDELHIKLEGALEGNVKVSILNLHGQSVHAKDGTAEMFRDYTVSTEKMGMPTGFYIVQIQQANGKRIVQKFMKE